MRPRLIPCLLIKDNGLVKTINFDNPKYLGDPLNTVRIFNEKKVDELIVLDIDASRLKKDPNYKLLAKIANECNMPLCYGGGIKSISQCERLINLGIEKLALSSVVFSNKKIINEASKKFGSQSVVVVLDIKKSGLLKKKYEIFYKNGKSKIKLNLHTFIKEIESLGAGEIVINSIDNDGLMKGYDIQLISEVKDLISIPLTAIGGAGSLQDAKHLWKELGLVGAGAGSLFVFKGKNRAVLITYPKIEEKNILFKELCI